MNNKPSTEQLLNDFVDDINTGVTPRIWTHLEEYPDDALTLIPIMKSIGTLKARALHPDEADKETIRQRILQQAKTKGIIKSQ